MLGFLGVRLLRWLHAKAGELCARGTASRVATATETRWGVKFARDEKVRGNQSIPYTVGGVSIRRREARLQRSSRSSHFKPTSSHVSTRNFFYPTRETPTRPHSMNWGTRYTVKLVNAGGVATHKLSQLLQIQRLRLPPLGSTTTCACTVGSCSCDSASLSYSSTSVASRTVT